MVLFSLLTTGCAGRFFYHPNDVRYHSPADADLAFERVTFSAPGGPELEGWFIPAEGEPRGTVVHFHGNAQNMTAHLSFVHWLAHEGFNLVTFDYRGYGRSKGRPSRRGLHADGLAALRYTAARPEVDPSRIVVLGQSLGGAVALSVLGREDIRVRACAVDSSFYSYRSMVRDKIGQLGLVGKLLKWPLSFLVVGNSYSPGPVVDNIAPVPLLFFHGVADRTVPPAQGRRLYEAAGEPKAIRWIDEGRHTDALMRHGGVYREQLVDFFKQGLDGP